MGAGVVMLALVLIWYALPDQARGRAVPAAAGAADARIVVTSTIAQRRHCAQFLFVTAKVRISVFSDPKRPRP